MLSRLYVFFFFRMSFSKIALIFLKFEKDQILQIIE